ncbi:hypothetical protein HK100_006701, partial [Physocladia obscura]
MSAEDIVSGTPHLVLGLVWQVIKVGLLQHVATAGGKNTSNSSQDIVSKVSDASTTCLENGLVKWVNWTLKNENIKISNFGPDLSDSRVLAHLIASFDDDTEARALRLEKVLTELDVTHRAELVLEYAARFGCRHFTSPADIVGGNRKLNLAFVAVLHNSKISRDKNNPSNVNIHSEVKKLLLQLEDAQKVLAWVQTERDALKIELDELKQRFRDQEKFYSENKVIVKLERMEETNKSYGHTEHNKQETNLVSEEQHHEKFEEKTIQNEFQKNELQKSEIQESTETLCSREFLSPHFEKSVDIVAYELQQDKLKEKRLFTDERHTMQFDERSQKVIEKLTEKLEIAEKRLNLLISKRKSLAKERKEIT